jgi:hypothetical protein
MAEATPFSSGGEAERRSTYETAFVEVIWGALSKWDGFGPGACSAHSIIVLVGPQRSESLQNGGYAWRTEQRILRTRRRL